MLRHVALRGEMGEGRERERERVSEKGPGHCSVRFRANKGIIDKQRERERRGQSEYSTILIKSLA